MSEKLPVFATLKEGWTVFLRDGRRVALWLVILGLSWAIAEILFMNATGWPALPVPGQPVMHPKPEVWLTFLGGSLVFDAVLLPIITSYQRLILQGAGARVGFAYRREEWSVVWGFIRLGLLSCGVLIVALVLLSVLLLIVFKVTALKPQSVMGISAIISLPVIIPCFALVCRCFLMFPAVADGCDVSLRKAYRAGKNNTWRLMAVGFCPFLVLVVFQQIVLLMSDKDLKLAVTIAVPAHLALILYLSGVWALAYRKLLRPALLAAAEPPPDPAAAVPIKE